MSEPSLADVVHEAVEKAKADHVHDTGYFDRTLCPEPCGAMHSYCSVCGERQDPCAFPD